MNTDFADFLDALNREGVAYVVIGGLAVLRHVPYRTTRDLDVLIEPTLENAEKARRAVRRWLGTEHRFEAKEFIAGDVLSFGGVLRVEIHSKVPGVIWADAWKRREAGYLLGIATQFASLPDLIAMKEAAARRGKDLPDARRLRKLADRGKRKRRKRR